MRRYIFIILGLMFLSGTSIAQYLPERGLVRRGNRNFNKERYERSSELYEKALAASPSQFEASYNLANALFRLKRYDKAQQILEKLSKDSLRCETDRGDVAFNLGNVLVSQNKLKEALAQYKQAMRMNPNDQQAKYNYAYVKKLLEQQEQNQNQDQNQNKDQNQDQNKDQNKQNENQKDNQQDQQDKQNQDNKEDNQNENQNDPQSQKPQPSSGIDDKEQQAMLDAIQAQEDKTQDKLKEKKGVVIVGGKNW
ncbi:MAG: tetratricopeptide repeat protein [Alistipes sp.]|nr:tetratricopeptide repeat protein [Candidatus Alistipes equi]